jgi:hypothetical protein
MNKKSRKIAGILLITLPTVAYGGTALLSMLTTAGSGYMDNPLRQNLFRAGHAHAGVLLILSLVILKYVDETNYGEKIKNFIRIGAPVAAILIPAAFFFSVLSPDATAPNGLINLAYIGFVILAITFLLLGIGLIRERKNVAV